MVQLFKGDCLELLKNIPDGSINLILTDPPYGNMKGAELDGWDKNKTLWDDVICPIFIFSEAKRILRKNGKLILFSQEPYTSDLITKSVPAVPFNYRMIWEKDHFANALLAKKAPVSYFEDILVFTKMNIKHDFEGLHPLREYFKNVFGFIGHTKRQIINDIGSRVDHTFRYNSSQFELCTEETYTDLIEWYKIDTFVGFKPYEQIEEIHRVFKDNLITEMTFENPNIFNLPMDQRYKSNILKYKKDYNGYHPTQKPVPLLEDLIKTYTNVSNKVLDFTMGSGSTGVAAVNLGRDFIGIERDDKYFAIAEKRISEAEQQSLF